MPLLISEGGPVIHIIVFVIDFYVEHLHMFRNAPLWLHCFGTHLSWVLSHFPLLAVPN